MPGTRGTERRRLSSQVLVRLPSVTHAAVTARAAAARLTEAAWIRGRLVDLLGADPTDAVPVAARRPPRPLPTADVIEIARLRESVGEAVGTLRQVAGLDRSRGGPRLAEIDAALDRLIAAAADLDAAKRTLMRHGEGRE